MSEELRAAQSRIEEHPGSREHANLEALDRSIGAVFLPNLRELVGVLDSAATDGELAIELVQNVREPIVRLRFHAEVTQRLHNYLVGAQSLVDHVRRLMRGRVGPIAEEFATRKAELLRGPEIPFMVDLRNFTLHRTLPFFGHTLSVTGVNTPEQEVESEVLLNVPQLFEWDGWSAPARVYLDGQHDALSLRPIVKKHGEMVLELNAWLLSELAKTNKDSLDEVNTLIVARNAVLTGGDPENGEEAVARRFQLVVLAGEA